MKPAWMICVYALAALAVQACSTRPAPSGLTEPIRVRDGQFVVGDAPGALPPEAGPSPVIPDASPAEPPRITTVDSLNNLIYPGESGKKLTGHATGTSWAVGLRFRDLGTGYWIVPIGVPDPQTQNELTWDAVCDFARDIPPGFHELVFFAIDEQERVGEQRSLPVCIPLGIPDNLHACDPRIAPPAAVISLTWDTNVDLDLQVVTPDGKLVDGKHPSTALIGDAGTVPSSAGVLDRDSNAGCVIDSMRQEDLVWQTYPPSGRYTIRVNLFDSCKQASVRFTVGVYTAEGEGDKRHLGERFRRSGEVLDFQAAGTSQPGLFITEFVFF